MSRSEMPSATHKGFWSDAWARISRLFERVAGLFERVAGLFERIGWIIIAIVILVLFATNLAWPTAFLFVALAFRQQISSFFNNVEEFLTKAEAIDLDIQGVKIKISARQAGYLIQDLVNTLISQMAENQKRLFFYIVKHRSEMLGKTLGNGPLNFERKTQVTVLHNDLRELRNRNLLRPQTGGQWKAEKYLEITPFGDLVAKSVQIPNALIEENAFKDYLKQSQEEYRRLAEHD